MLVSSMGITFSTHYCMGRAVDSQLMIGAHELSCGMMDMESSCDREGDVIMPPGCCDNSTISIEIKDDYNIDFHSLSLDITFLYEFTYTLLTFSPAGLDLHIPRSDFHPPPLAHDYQSMYQSFLL